MNIQEIVKLHLTIIIVCLISSLVFMFLNYRVNQKQLAEDKRINDFIISQAQ